MQNQLSLIQVLDRKSRANAAFLRGDFVPTEDWHGIKLREPDLRGDFLGMHFVGYSSLSARIGTTFGWTAQNTINTLLNPASQQTTLSKQQAFSTNNGNTAVGGADLLASFQQALSSGSNAIINLGALTGILQGAITPARIKSCQIRLLSGSDDPGLTPTPNVSSTVTVTNNNVTIPHPLYFATGGSGLTVALTVSTGAVTGVTIGAAGSGYPPSTCFLAAPNQASGAGCVFAVVTNSSGVPTSVVFITGSAGTGYTAATVPTTVVGQFTLNTGNAQCNIDVTAAGLVIGTASKNIAVYNNDQAHATTVEFDFILGSS